MKKVLKGINFVISLCLILLALAVLYVAVPIFGNKALIVRSGSMTPTIAVGSIVVVRPAEQNIISPVTSNVLYNPGDVISFKLEKNSKTIVTHRIKSIEQGADGVFYKTKGDANKTVDGWSVDQRNVLGKVDFFLPYAGQFLAFAKSTQGLALLIIFPAVMVMLIETITIIKEIRKKRSQENHSSSDQASHMNLFQPKVIVPIIATLALTIPMTFAFLNDTETSKNNTFTAAASFASPTPTGSVTPTPIPGEVFGDAVTSVVGTFGHCCDANDLSSSPAVAAASVTGAPDSPPDSDFIQISDNSSVTVQFNNNKAIAGTGPDIRVHVYDALFPGDALIEVSDDPACLVGFVSTGVHSDTANVDIDINGLGLTQAFCVRITDLVASPDNQFPTLGFDLDAIEALNSQVYP